MIKILYSFIESATLVAMVYGCNPANGKQPGGTQSAMINPLSLVSKEEICGHVISLSHLDPAQGGVQNAYITIQVAVCGSLAPGKTWKALGMTLAGTNEAFLRSTSTPSFTATPEAQATLVADASLDLYAVKSGKRYKIGHLAGSSHAAIITPAAGTSFDVAIGERAFQIGDPKSTPASDKALWYYRGRRRLRLGETGSRR